MSQELGLNDAWYSVWFRWLGDALSGEWGTSRVFAQPVADIYLFMLLQGGCQGEGEHTGRACVGLRG